MSIRPHQQGRHRVRKRVLSDARPRKNSSSPDLHRQQSIEHTKRSVMNIQGSAQHIDIMIDIITEKLNKNSYEKESRTKSNQHRVENYTSSSKQRILGFFFLSSTVSVSAPYTQANLGCFQSLFALLFVPFHGTHIAPWRLLLRPILVASLPPFGNSNGYFQLPKKKLN